MSAIAALQPMQYKRWIDVDPKRTLTPDQAAVADVIVGYMTGFKWFPSVYDFDFGLGDVPGMKFIKKKVANELKWLSVKRESVDFRVILHICNLAARAGDKDTYVDTKAIIIFARAHGYDLEQGEKLVDGKTCRVFALKPPK